MSPKAPSTPKIWRKIEEGISQTAGGNPMASNQNTRSSNKSDVVMMDTKQQDLLLPYKPQLVNDVKSKNTYEVPKETTSSGTSSFISSTSFLAGSERAPLQSKKVCVYPRTPGFVLPDGGTVLPFSDEKWVAVSFDFGNEDGGGGGGRV